MVCTGCVVEAPADIESPSVTISFDDEIAAFEREACADAASDACALLRAADASDGAASDPPRLPDVVPHELRWTSADGAAATVDSASWLAGLEERLSLARTVAYDAAAMVDDHAALATAELKDVHLVLHENTWTIPVPTLAVHLVEGGVEGATAAARGDEPRAPRVGVVEAAPVGTVGALPVVLAAGGRAAIGDATAAGEATFVVLADGGPDDASPIVDEDRGLRLPRGAATYNIRARLLVPADATALLAAR